MTIYVPGEVYAFIEQKALEAGLETHKYAYRVLRKHFGGDWPLEDKHGRYLWLDFDE